MIGTYCTSTSRTVLLTLSLRISPSVSKSPGPKLQRTNIYEINKKIIDTLQSTIYCNFEKCEFWKNFKKSQKELYICLPADSTQNSLKIRDRYIQKKPKILKAFSFYVKLYFWFFIRIFVNICTRVRIPENYRLLMHHQSPPKIFFSRSPEHQVKKTFFLSRTFKDLLLTFNSPKLLDWQLTKCIF